MVRGGRAHLPLTTLTTHLKIQTQRKIPHWFTIKEAAHGPAGIHSQKVAQQSASHSKTISSHKRTYATILKSYLNRREAISCRWPADFVVSSIPCGSQINELNQLEIP